MGLMPYMQKASEGLSEEGGEAIGTMDMVEMMDFSANLLPSYVVSMRGLFDGDGDEMEFKDIQGEAYFMDLLSEIVQALFEVSNMSKKERKNSQRQSTTSVLEPAKSEVKSSVGSHVKVGLELSSDVADESSGAGPMAETT
jgi:hypothetical protein